jgi:hypothetical protein
MELVITDADQSARARELSALEGGGDALIRGAGQQDEDDRGDAHPEGAARGWSQERH